MKYRLTNLRSRRIEPAERITRVGISGMKPWYLLTIDTAYIPKRLTMTIENSISSLILFAGAAVSVGTVIMPMKVESWLPSSTRDTTCGD